MNGRANCLLGVCCLVGSEKQRGAMTDQIVEDTGLDKRSARTAADWFIDHLDAAPKGSLGALKAAIAKLAREPQE